MAFRTNDPETKSPKNVVWLSDPPEGYEEKITCGTCGQHMRMLAVVAGLWKVEYKPT